MKDIVKIMVNGELVDIFKLGENDINYLLEEVVTNLPTIELLTEEEELKYI